MPLLLCRCWNWTWVLLFAWHALYQLSHLTSLVYFIYIKWADTMTTDRHLARIPWNNPCKLFSTGWGPQQIPSTSQLFLWCWRQTVIFVLKTTTLPKTSSQVWNFTAACEQSHTEALILLIRLVIDACLLTLKMLAMEGRRAGRGALLITGGANPIHSALVRHNEPELRWGRRFVMYVESEAVIA